MQEKVFGCGSLPFKHAWRWHFNDNFTLHDDIEELADIPIFKDSLVRLVSPVAQLAVQELDRLSLVELALLPKVFVVLEEFAQRFDI